MLFILIIIRFVINRIKISSWLLVQQKKKLIHLLIYSYNCLFLLNKSSFPNYPSFTYKHFLVQKSMIKLHDHLHNHTLYIQKTWTQEQLTQTISPLSFIKSLPTKDRVAARPEVKLARWQAESKGCRSQRVGAQEAIVLRNYQLEGKLVEKRQGRAWTDIRERNGPIEGRREGVHAAEWNVSFSRENVKVSRIGRLLECLGELLV